MKIIIVDKDFNVSKQLEQDLNGIGFNVVNNLSSYKESISVINRIVPDCVVCAFNLNEKHTGLELASHLSYLRLPFLFIDSTPNLDNLRMAKNYHLGHYIAKPYNILSIKAAIDDIVNDVCKYYSSHIYKGKYIFLKRNSIFEKVSLHSISRLRSAGNYTLVYTNGIKYIIKISLTKLLMLPHFNSFFRIHRNYAVQKDKIDKVDFSNRNCETFEEIIPFGRTYAKKIRELMNLPYNNIQNGNLDAE